MTDVLVIGGGPNGLVAAAFLARGGHRVVVLERHDRPGGGARTTEIAAGFRCPTLSHAASIDPTIVGALALDRHGLEIIQPEAAVCAAGAGGRALVLWRDTARAAREIAAHSAHDAAQYPKFLDSVRHIGAVIRTMARATPPSIDDPTGADLVELLKAGRAFRGLTKADAYRLLRWMPMAVADLAGEWFESEPLRATVAAAGIVGSFLGPWSAGSAALLLWLGAGDGHSLAPGWFAKGGVGAVGDALTAAARQAGVEIRTGVDVERITVANGAANGVTLASGQELTASAVVSSLDPKRTLVGLVDPLQLDPEFARRVRNFRANGVLAKINYAVGELPRFGGLAALDEATRRAALSGRIRLGRDIDAIERAFDAAKYGGFADEPWIELAIPSLTDPSLAPPERHVVSAYVQYAPYQLRESSWEAAGDRLAEVATATIDRAAPGFAASILARQTLTPLDLERTYGLTGGHIFHGDLALDQLFVTRPILGWARYSTPIRNLYLCGSGTHPGSGLDGRSGALAAKVIARELARRAR